MKHSTSWNKRSFISNNLSCFVSVILNSPFKWKRTKCVSLDFSLGNNSNLYEIIVLYRPVNQVEAIAAKLRYKSGAFT